MGYGSAGLGALFRERLIRKRIEERKTDIAAADGVTDEELETLGPYITFVSRFGSRRELIALALLFSPFVLILLLLLGGTLFTGVVLTLFTLGESGGASAGLMTALNLFVALLPLALVGVIVRFLYKRWRRYKLATTIEEYLTDAPQQLLGDQTPLPKNRDEVAGLADHDSFW